MPKVLIIGIGNSSRGDDALGWLFAEKCVSYNYPNLDVQMQFQLVVEDAFTISKYDLVFFADATKDNLSKGYQIKEMKIQDAVDFTFTTHTQSPENILLLAADLFKAYPKAYTIAISGYHWELGAPVTDQALLNLQNAESFFNKILNGILEIYKSPLNL